MNRRQWYVLTAGLVLMALSCLFPLWNPSSGDFTFLFRPPPWSTLDGARLALEWFFLAIATGVGLVLTRRRSTIPTVVPVWRHLPIVDTRPDVLTWKRKQKRPHW
jgi:hypothetical protein